MNFTKVDGGNKEHSVRIIALSTCGWCRQLKKFLQEQGIAYEYVDVDLCSRDEKREITMFLKEHNLPLTFPLTIVDESTFISGYRPEEFSKALELDFDK
ncbi:MAG: glutaredoxin family protein [Candidatus Bathyarchaeota archaeon]